MIGSCPRHSTLRLPQKTKPTQTSRGQPDKGKTFSSCPLARAGVTHRATAVSSIEAFTGGHQHGYVHIRIPRQKGLLAFVHANPPHPKTNMPRATRPPLPFPYPTHTPHRPARAVQRDKTAGSMLAATTPSSAPTPDHDDAAPLPSVVAVEAAPDSLLLGWQEVEGAVSYELQMGKTPVTEGYVEGKFFFGGGGGGGGRKARG